MPSLAARDEAHPVIRWLMTEARRRADPNEFLEAFAHELRAADVDVSRITTGVPILHPQIFSFSGLWELGKGTTERLFRSGPDVAVTMANSPIRIAYQGGGPVSCDLTLPPQQGEFAILEACAARALRITSCIQCRSPTAATRRFRLQRNGRAGFAPTKPCCSRR